MPTDKPFGDEEPSALMREGARHMREIFVACCQEGFTESQALVIIGQILAANTPRQEGS